MVFYNWVIFCLSLRRLKILIIRKAILRIQRENKMCPGQRISAFSMFLVKAALARYVSCVVSMWKDSSLRITKVLLWIVESGHSYLKVIETNLNVILILAKTSVWGKGVLMSQISTLPVLESCRLAVKNLGFNAKLSWVYHTNYSTIQHPTVGSQKSNTPQVEW